MANPLKVLIAILVTLLAVAPASADTVDEKPRLAVAIKAAPAGFVRALTAKLAATKRFEVLPNGAAARGKLAGIQLGPAITLTSARRARELAGAELLLDGVWQPAGSQVRITSRLFDFRTGEFSRDLSLNGESGSADALAGQLVAFVRHFAPLRCLVKDTEEDQLILDLGEADGVTVGALFRIYRHPLNMKPRELGLVRVTEVEPFAARAEVEEAPQGTRFERGDVALEQTAGLLFR